jgi:N-methylhydantoinase B
VATETYSAATADLASLSDAEFADRYDCDRLTASVLASKLRYVATHMSSGLLTTAFSVILRDWYDFATTFCGPPEDDYPMPAVSDSLLLFSGTMAEAVRNTVEEYGAQDLERGDVLLCNDPYRAGTHVNDVAFIRPVFALDHEGPVGFTTIRAHMADLGGIYPGGHSHNKRNVYENGLVMSPRLLYRRDEPVKETWNLIFDNSRFGELVKSDIWSIYQNLLLGERLVLDAIERYGVDAYRGAIRYTCDQSAESMRQSIAALPDGVYHGEELIDCDAVDDSEEYRIEVSVVVAGDRLEVDLSGTSRQARTCINAGWLDAKCAVGVALKFLINQGVPFTSGLYRNIDIVLPEGTCVSALPPDGAIYLYWEMSEALLLAVFRALAGPLGADAVPGNMCSGNVHSASGLYKDGTRWVCISQAGGEHGPWPGTKVGDGDSYQIFMMANNLDPATETMETDAPVVQLRKDYVMDSAGPGRHRGGVAFRRDSMWLHESQHQCMPLHYKTPSGFGAYGGKEGATGGVWLWDTGAYDVKAEKRILGDDERIYRAATPIAGVLAPDTNMPVQDETGVFHHYARIPTIFTDPYTTFRYVTNGAGGWGDPLERDVRDVLADVRDEYVSIESAASDYGVVVEGDVEKDPEGLSVDEQATARLREEISAISG